MNSSQHKEWFTKLLIQSQEGMHMNEIEGRVNAQLTVIEQVYDIKIQNREEIISLTAENIDDPRQVLMVCTMLNTWIANNNMQGTVVIPQSLVLSLIERMQ